MEVEQAMQWQTELNSHGQKNILSLSLSLSLSEDEAHVLLDCFVYGNIRNVYINKAQNISLEDQVLSVLNCEQFGCPWKVLVSSSANA